jgi:translation initiation factor 3 subunit E
MKQKRETVVSKMKQLKAESGPILKLIEDDELVRKLRAEKQFNTTFLEENYQITTQDVENLYEYAKLLFECGDYTQAKEHLYHFRALNTNPEKNFSSLWGKLACEILLQLWDDAFKDLGFLREIIETKNFPPLKLLQQRTWFIHWSLFVYFNHQNRATLVDLLMNERYLNTIQTTCPHILRYLAVLVIINKKKRSVLKELVKAIQQENHVYRDPITEFLVCLELNFDFENARTKLTECEKVLENDFFLVAVKEDFLENARLLIFETYCTIHHRMSVSAVAQILGFDVEKTEAWINNLVRSTKGGIEAKIENNSITISNMYPNVSQKILEKTRSLAFRAHLLSTNLSEEVKNTEEY